MLSKEEQIILNRFLDAEGRIKTWPTKKLKQEIIYKFLATHLEPNRIYTEHEINLILASAHTFNDYFLLRRGLITSGYLIRKPNGSAYWVKHTLE
ncbi:DUF2087 domain-containing protein [Fusibacter ferrireducens]|uniref:DUF2087 domain-containing protein n=1 Tax=Fusibacter ferrireducens TaxID=2785058 RepID=A0ABR9ZU31_9FIRM|nr:DUF2087 domain-containing protein [Fusibacter ferrireducens]MBF4693985.1 DUF2087 domain-containing protein [Fusibacter ferrireducens]